MPKYGQATPADRQLRLPRVILGRISRGGCGPAGNPHTREDRRQKVGLARLATHCKASSLTSHVTTGFGIGQEFRIKSAHHARQTAVICTLEALPNACICMFPTIFIYISQLSNWFLHSFFYKSFICQIDFRGCFSCIAPKIIKNAIQG